MAPTPSPTLIHAPNLPSVRYLHRLRRQALPFHHPPGQSSVPRAGRSGPHILDAPLQSSVVFEGPPPPLTSPMPSESAVLAQNPPAIPVKDNQPQGPTPPTDVTGNIVAGVVVIVLILGGLIGLVIGGEILRRRARTMGEKASPPSSKCFGRRKSKTTRKVTESSQRCIKMSREKFPYDEKTLSPLARPPPALNRERQRRFSELWPIRSLSRALYNRRSRREQVKCSVEPSPPVANPPTTWSDFSSVSLYAAPSRTVLSRIPEELEDCESQTDIAVILGITLQRSPEPDLAVSASRSKRPRPSHGVLLEGSNEPELSVTAERRGSRDFQPIHKAGTRDEETKSLESSAPDMTSDEGDSSRSSMASLMSLEGGHDKGSLREEVFELRRAQTKSMQMNRGVLLSLSLKTLDDSQSLESTHEELDCGLSRSPSISSAGGSKDYLEREMSLAILGGSFTAVSLDEFPSPPSVLPMIPSFVSTF